MTVLQGDEAVTTAPAVIRSAAAPLAVLTHCTAAALQQTKTSAPQPASGRPRLLSPEEDSRKRIRSVAHFSHMLTFFVP